jgi:diaminopimelate epimerase
MLLSKHHSLGDDFLVALDERNDGSVAVDAELARRLCDRRRGVGADGLIHGRRPTAEQAQVGIDVVMVRYDADGSRAKVGGEGIGCLGHAVARARGLDSGVVDVLTASGRHPVTLGRTDEPSTLRARVDMGVVWPGPPTPALDEYLTDRHGTVDMGNPHLVILVEDPDLVALATEGARLAQQFTWAANVDYIAVDRAAGTLRLRIWERGVGATEACSTGACAAAFQAHAWGLVGDEVEVVMPGGAATVLLGDAHHQVRADETYRFSLADQVSLVSPSVFIADIGYEASGDRISVDAR